MKSFTLGAVFLMLFAINSKASECSDFSGIYNFQGQALKIKQIECKSMAIIDIDSGAKVDSWVFDGVQRKTGEIEPGYDPVDDSYGEGMEMYEAHTISGNVMTSVGFVRNKTTKEEEPAKHTYTLLGNGDIKYEVSQGSMTNNMVIKRQK